MRITKRTLIFTVGALAVIGCQSAIEKAARNTQYSAYEFIGVEKRDLLKSRVDKARDEQKQAGKTFETALERLKSVSNIDGGSLEREYRSLQSSYDRAEEQAQDVRIAIQKVETVAGDLFEEWQKELKEIKTASLHSSSRRKLDDTRKRYSEMMAALKASETRMGPILSKFKDQTLFLKHNLNAAAVGSLKSESVRIQRDIENLIREMNKSIASADQFIQTLK